MTTAIFNPLVGVQDIIPGKETEFFEGMTDDEKKIIANFNAIGIVLLEVLESFQPIIVPPSPTYKSSATKSLKDGIKAAGCNPDTEISEARENLKKLSSEQLVQLCLVFMK